MNNDQKYFEQKFKECSKHIKANPKDIISLKYREIRDHNYYQELLLNLSKIGGLEIINLGHIMNGVSYKISYGSQSIIIVEHETGLEILYISGSIASLIGLVLQVASMINDRRRRMHSYSGDLRDVEVRYFDKNNNFVDEHRPDYFPFEIFLLPQALISDIEKLDKRVSSIEKKIKQLTDKQKNKSS